MIFVLLLLCYTSWELYWYSHVGLAFIKWHTHPMVYVYIGFAGSLLFKAFGKSPSNRVKNIALVSGTTLFSLFVIEVLFSLTGANKTYLEKASGHYQSLYEPFEKDYYHIWPSGKEHWLTKPEFSYWRPTNSLGFADMEWPVPKKPKHLRILSLGDSFTEGDGAPYDSSYVAILRRNLSASGDSVYVMNGGTCGSDPFNNYMNLKDRLIPYGPDIIIQSLGSGDMNTDILLRGGMERFQKDGTVKYLPAPWWEPIYALNYVSRIFFHAAGYSELLRKNTITPAEIKRVNESVKDLFTRYSTLCREHNIRLFIVLHPEKQEVEHNKYDYDLSPLLSYLASDTQVTVIDLLPSYRSYIEKSHSNVAEYYWKYDGHHNSKGYKMMAETTWQNIGPALKDSTKH